MFVVVVVGAPERRSGGGIRKGPAVFETRTGGGGVERSGFGARPLRWFWGGCGSVVVAGSKHGAAEI